MLLDNYVKIICIYTHTEEYFSALDVTNALKAEMKLLCSRTNSGSPSMISVRSAAFGHVLQHSAQRLRKSLEEEK